MPHPTIHAVCLASSGRALSGTCSGPAAFVNNRKKTSLHESILSGIKARFGALARYAAALDEKAAARLSAADHPQQAAKQLETLLRLPETGTLLHFEAGDGGFLEAFHAARPGWELSAIESGDAFMRLLKKAFLRSAYNADYRDADIVSRFDIIAVTKPLDEVEKPLNAVRWLSRRLADNGTLFLWQPALRMGTGLSLHGLPIRIANLTALCKTAGLSVDRLQRKAKSSASVPGIRLNANTRGNLLKCVSPKNIEEKAGSPPHGAPKEHKAILLHGKSPPYEPRPENRREKRRKARQKG